MSKDFNHLSVIVLTLYIPEYNFVANVKDTREHMQHSTFHRGVMCFANRESLLFKSSKATLKWSCFHNNNNSSMRKMNVLVCRNNLKRET